MPERQYRIKTSNIEAGYIDGSSLPQESEVIEEWKPEPPTYYWSDWKVVSETVDKDPTYFAEHNHDGGLFRTPTLRRLSPYRRKTIKLERRKYKRWVDSELGLMVQCVDTETRTERT